MITALYIIWFTIPICFFLMAAWSQLEQVNESNRKHDAKDLYKQGLFVLGCAFAALALNEMLLEPVVGPTLPKLVPLGVLQVLLLPAVLTIGAHLIGGSKPVRIERSSRSKRTR